jgi:hypothetical protein
MAFTCSIYKGPILLGTGSATAGSATIGSVTATNERTIGEGRNISITITEAGTHIGRTWRSRVMADGGTSLTLARACPFE